MDTVKIKVTHPDTHLPTEIDAPVSKLKIPIDIFFDGEDVLIVRFKGSAKRRAILETNDNNQWITNRNGRIWKFAGVALITKEKCLLYGLPYKGNSIPEIQWNYNTSAWRA